MGRHMRYISLVLFGLALLSHPAHSEAKTVDWTVVDSQLLSVEEGGAIVVWLIETHKIDAPRSRLISARPVNRIAFDGTILWAVSNQFLLQWSETDGIWLEHSRLPLESEELIDLLAVGDDIVAVYPTKIIRLLSPKVYTVPELGGQLSIDYLRVLASHVDGTNIWFGTGQGEWGGHLVQLDIATGEWKSYYDDLHYVTGITHTSGDELIVTWSMSHFMADTLVRVHHFDTRVRREFPMLDSKYYQSIAYDPETKTLYAVEQNDIVEVIDGIPHRIADLGKLSYEIEPDAIGVAPGVLGMSPLPGGILLIIHRSSPPLMLKDGEITRFSS